jgi:hypothetical protein
MLLYKYCPPERIDVLQSGLIAYSEPLVFNDPFEFELILTNPSPENVALAKARDLGTDNAERSRLDTQIEQLQDLEGQVRLTLEQAARALASFRSARPLTICSCGRTTRRTTRVFWSVSTRQTKLGWSSSAA